MINALKLMLIEKVKREKAKAVLSVDTFNTETLKKMN